MADWNELKQSVEQNGNVLTITMEQLRDAAGAGKLGVHVREEVSRTLAGMGLGHIPQVLPSYQHELVRWYKQGTPVGELIATVLDTGAAERRQKLSGQFAGGGHDYAAVVQRIRELVAE